MYNEAPATESSETFCCHSAIACQLTEEQDASYLPHQDLYGLTLFICSVVCLECSYLMHVHDISGSIGQGVERVGMAG